MCRMSGVPACALSLAALTACAASGPDDGTIGKARSAQVWSAEAELKQSGTPAQGNFGAPVAISGDTALVGAPSWKPISSPQGAAYVFVRTQAGWTQQAFLTDAFATFFGSSVAISGDTAVIGAIAGGGGAGAAYFFQRIGSEWSQQAALYGPGGEFGYSASVGGDTAVVGAPYANKATIFTRSGTSWDVQTVLSAPAPTDVYFGISVSVSGDTCLVGEQGGAAGGRVFVYDRTGDTWNQSAILTGPDIDPISLFGTSVSLDSDTAVVRGLTKLEDGGAGVPAAYVFVRKGGSWQQEATLAPPDGDFKHTTGGSVALSGDVAILAAGTLADQTLPTTHVAYVFRRTSGVWALEGDFERSASSGYNIRGTSVGVSGDTAVVGIAESRICAPMDDTCSSTPLNKSAFVLRATGGDASVDAEASGDFSPEHANIGGGCKASGRGAPVPTGLALMLIAHCAWIRRRSKGKQGIDAVVVAVLGDTGSTGAAQGGTCS